MSRARRPLVLGPPGALGARVPLPVCQCARAYRCWRFGGEARSGKDTLIRQTFYGFRLHARICWPGVITRIELAPANLPEGEVVLELTGGGTGLLVGDRNSWRPPCKQAWRKRGRCLVTPFRRARRAPAQRWSRVLGRVRSWMDTVCGHLVEGCQAKRVWARDWGHERNRLLRLVLMPTLAVLFKSQEAAPPLQLDHLVA